MQRLQLFGALFAEEAVSQSHCAGEIVPDLAPVSGQCFGRVEPTKFIVKSYVTAYCQDQAVGNETDPSQTPAGARLAVLPTLSGLADMTPLSPRTARARHHAEPSASASREAGTPFSIRAACVPIRSGLGKCGP